MCLLLTIIFLDCMEALTSVAVPPTTSSSTKDTVTTSAQQDSSPLSSLPTITETPDPPVEEASSPQESGMYVVMRYISYYGMLYCKPLPAGMF